MVAVIAIVAVGAVAAMTVFQPPPPEDTLYAFLLPGSITDSGWNTGMYLAAQAADDNIEGISVDITYGLGQVGVEGVDAEQGQGVPR